MEGCTFRQLQCFIYALSKLNHMYTEVVGEISTNDEYFNQVNVPAYVIGDISKWIDSIK